MLTQKAAFKNPIMSDVSLTELFQVCDVKENGNASFNYIFKKENNLLLLVLAPSPATFSGCAYDLNQEKSHQVKVTRFIIFLYNL